MQVSPPKDQGDLTYRKVVPHMKLCIHCVYYIDHPKSKDPNHGLCEKSPRTYSLVTGEVEKDHEFCSTYRISACGQKARFFEPILGLDVANETPEAQVFPITMQEKNHV